MLASLHVTDSLQQGFDRFFAYLPNVLGFVVILVVGYLIAKIIRSVVARALHAAKVDATLQKTPAGTYIDRVSPGGRPSKLVAAIVFWFVMLYVLTAALGALKIPAVTGFIDQVLGYLPNVVAAIVIFVVAAVISGGIVALVRRTMGDTPTGRIAQSVAPGLVMVIAVFMILNQLQIAPEIVTITYAALLGMLALAGALAFGLGGRDVAASIVRQSYENHQGAASQAKIDLRDAKDRAQQQLSDSARDAKAARDRSTEAAIRLAATSDQLLDRTVRSADGAELGRVTDVYFDEATGRPEWVAMKAGHLGSQVVVVPVATAYEDNGAIAVPYSRGVVETSPHHSAGAPLSREQEASLFLHYGVPFAGETVTAQVGAPVAPTSPSRLRRYGSVETTR